MQISRRQFIGMTAGGAAMSPWLTRLASVDAKKKGFTFAVVGDLHVTDVRSAAIVHRAVRSINMNEDVEFTIVAGDLATDGRLMELNLAKNALDRLAKPYYTIPGNHDVDLTLEDEYGNFNRAFSWENWEETDRGWVFLGIDSCDGTASDVSIREDQMAWLAKQIKRIKKERPIALFVHHPFNPNSKAYRVRNADAVLDLFSGRMLKLVAAGHYHGNQVEEREGVLFTTTACCSTTRSNFDGTDPKGYRLFHVENDDLMTEFVEVRA